MNSKTKILLIEDNPGDARLVKEYLFERNATLYDFDHADSLHSGLTLLNNKKVDVILLDLSLPDSHGLDTFIGLNTKYPGVPVVVLTGNDDDEMAARAVHLGAQDYLVKNRIDGSILNRVITYALERNYLNAEFKKLNRTLKVLSKVNRTVIRSDNEFELIKQICEVAVTLGDYPLVWVGYLNRDNGKITNVGHSGTGTDFDDIVKITCSNSGNENCPICQAIENNSVHVIQDIQDSNLDQLKQKAAKLGLKSLIIFPLKINRELNAAINIYSNEINGFNPNEIDLLTELAGDLAYGIRSIRTNHENIQAQIALVENERKFRLLAENSIDVIWQMDSRLRFTYASPSVYEMTGFTPDEWVGTRLSQHASTRAFFNMARKAVKALKNYKTFKHITFEAHMLRKDGSEYPVEISSKLIFNNKGFPIGLQGTTRDISERAAANEKIQINQERLESLMRISQHEANTIQELLDYALEEALELTESKIGYIYYYSEKDEQFILNTWSDGVIQECSITEPQSVYELDKTGLWGEAVRQRKPIIVNDFQAAHPLKKGHPKGHAKLNNFLTVPVVQNKQIVAVIGTANKSTDYDNDDVVQLTLLMDSVWKMVNRKEAEQALQESNEHFISMLENPLGYVLYRTQAGNDPMDNSVTHVSPSVIDILGIDETNKYNFIKWFENIYTEDLPLVIEANVRGCAPPFKFDETVRYNHPVKGLRWLHVRSNGIPNKGDPQKIGYANGIILDITDQKSAEEEKEKLLNQLLQSQKMDAVGQLAGGIAHDFNNLLTIISGNADLMLMNCPKDSLYQSNIDQIKKASDKAAALTRQLLTFSRKQIIQPKITSLNILVTNIKKMLQRLISEDIRLDTELAENLPMIKADEGQIEQVLMNMVVNARDAMPDGGAISIKTCLFTMNETNDGLAAKATPGNYIQLTISDTGTGIPPEILQHIFEPFFTTKESGKGTGLGLAVIYGIIEQHKGWIDVDTEPGKGSSFHVYLPVCEEAATEAQSIKDNVPAKTTHDETILILEDDYSVRELTKAMLERNGYTIITAGSCREAFDIFQREHADIDLVISDVVLPDGSGLNFIDTLATIKPDVKILMTSGYLDDKSQFEKIKNKGHHFIQKPYNYDAFIQLVHSLI